MTLDGNYIESCFDVYKAGLFYMPGECIDVKFKDGTEKECCTANVNPANGDQVCKNTQP